MFFIDFYQKTSKISRQNSKKDLTNTKKYDILPFTAMVL